MKLSYSILPPRHNQPSTKAQPTIHQGTQRINKPPRLHQTTIQIFSATQANVRNHIGENGHQGMQRLNQPQRLNKPPRFNQSLRHISRRPNQPLRHTHMATKAQSHNHIDKNRDQSNITQPPRFIHTATKAKLNIHIGLFSKTFSHLG